VRERDDEEEDENEKINRMKMEHARLEMQMTGLQALIQRTIQKEDDLKRRFKGVSLHENKEFIDNVKLKTDAQRKYDSAKKEFEFKDVVLKKMQAALDAKPPTDAAPIQQPVAGPSISNFMEEERVDIREPIEEGNDRIEFYDAGEHWCQQCNFFGNSVKDYLVHCQSEEHWAKVPEKYDAPWPLIRRFTNFAPDRQLAVIKGSQFMIPCKGFYCAICKMFCGDLETSEEHLFCVNHNRMVAKFYMSKPEYEHVFNKDKQAAHSKAEADARKRKREAEEKKIREEEMKKRKLEEEQKQREKELREKIIEESKYMKRIKDLADKAEKNRKKEDRKERDRDRKDKKDRRIISIDSDDNESSLESMPPVKKERPEDDIKIKKGCSVSISFSDQMMARNAFEMLGNKTIPFKNKFRILKGNEWEDIRKEDVRDVKEKTKTQGLESLKPPNPSNHVKPTAPVGRAEFDDNSNDNLTFNIASVSGSLNKGDKSNDTDGLSSEKKDPPVPFTATESMEVDCSDVEINKEKVKNQKEQEKEGKSTYDMVLNALNETVMDNLTKSSPIKPSQQIEPSREVPVSVTNGEVSAAVNEAIKNVVTFH